MPVLLTRRGVALRCLFEPDAEAVLDAETFVRLNYEGFFFCDPEERERFLQDPVAYCGLLTDPVSHRRFRPSSESPRAEHEGVAFLFESEATAAWFARAPRDYALPGYAMPDEDAGPSAE